MRQRQLWPRTASKDGRGRQRPPGDGGAETAAVAEADGKPRQGNCHAVCLGTPDNFHSSTDPHWTSRRARNNGYTPSCAKPGQWHDSYDFVRLHQPSAGYGVETEALEPAGDAGHRATRAEVVAYYGRVMDRLAADHGAAFLGETRVDLSSVDGGAGQAVALTRPDGTASSVRVTKRVVDARFLQPDLPIDTAPTFAYNESAIDVVPVNALAEPGPLEGKRKFVVVGAGKTGMDAVHHLLTKTRVDPSDILWVRPHEMWITARENIGSCLELLRDCAVRTAEGAQDELSLAPTFLEWERRGHLYRLDTDTVPTKFRDATLDKDELEMLRRVTHIARGGRVREVRSSDGALVLEDGTVFELPWDEAAPSDTLYVHCSAGAFNYSKQKRKEATEPVFAPGRIIVQDVYGTPGFCFAGSVVGRLEALELTDAERNAMCRAPRPAADVAPAPLGHSGGDVDGVVDADHGWVQRLSNLRRWRAVPELRRWLADHRLFNLRARGDEGTGKLVDETWEILKERGIV